MKNNKIWDIYLRLFHAILALSVIFAILSGLNANLEVHLIAVQIILFLIIFRFIWGFVGYKTARFLYFIKNPKIIKNYFTTGKSGIGHTPLGALSVIAMLGGIFLQLFSGLFTADDVLFEAPFYQFAGDYQELLQNFHTTFFIIIILLIVLHIAAIIFYKIKGRNLVKNMFNGGRTNEVFATKYLHLKAFLTAIISFGSTYFIFYTHF